MRLAILVAFVAGAAGCGLGSHDVEVTIIPSANVSDAELTTVRALEICAATSVHGAAMTFPLSHAMTRSERIVIHATSDHAMLTVGVIAHDAAGGTVALGNDVAYLDGSEPKKLAVSLDPPPTGGDDAVVHVTPGSYTLLTGQAVTLAADSMARWSVQEGDAGGTIDATGRYTAPATAGSYHVVADSTAYFGHHAGATVDVLDNGVALYVGALGGGGYQDGPRGVGRMSPAQGAATDGKTVYFATQDKLVRAIDLASGTLSTIAGGLDLTFAVDDVGRNARFGNSYGLVLDGIGNLYVADSDGRAVRKIVIATGTVTTFAGKLNNAGYADGAPGTAQLGYPIGLVSDGAGALYVADHGNCSIRKIDVATQTVTTIAGSPPGMPYSCGSTDGTGAAARFANPMYMAWDGAGHLYVIDNDTAALRRVDVASGAVSTVAKGHFGFLSWDGHSVWISNNNVYRVDSDGTFIELNDPMYRNSPLYLRGNSLMLFAPDGTFYGFDGESLFTLDTTTSLQTVVTGVRSTEGAESVFGDRAQTQLNGLNSFMVASDGTIYGKSYDWFFKVDPASGQTTKLFNSSATSACCAGIVTDGNGNLYGTTYDNAVLRISLSDGSSSVLAGMATKPGYQNGTGTQAQFNNLGDIALDGAGNAYVIDGSNFVIRKIVLATGEVTLFAGTPNMAAFADGTASSAQFSYLRALTYDGAGALYVGDSGNNRIRKVTVPGAVVTTLSGSGMLGHSDGPSTTATFYGPQGLTFDAAKQNLYVSDTLNNLLRKVAVADGSVSTVAGTDGLSFNQVGAFPAVLNQPSQLGFLPSGELLVQTQREASILQIRLP